MCGLAGEIACGPAATTDADRALPMLQAVLHRGPDGLGLWEDERKRACFLHARLSLVDPEGGAQPMTDRRESVVIVFNGEIYGFERARQVLEARGVSFQTRCDTEVLLQLYLQFGPDFVRSLEGEFAFALLDRRSGVTMLARDRFGVKPLFVAENNGLLLFGSEAKAILAHPWTERRLDMTVVNRRLQGVFLPQDTLFAGITAVEPGSYLLVSRDGIRTQRYADLDPAAMGSLQLSFDEAVEALEPVLAEAVRKRFHGDAPVGLFLSGGLDSSSVAAFTRAAVDQGTVKKEAAAYSIDFLNSADSERAASAETAGRLSMRRVNVEVDAQSLEDAFVESTWHSETIAPNTHGVAKMLLARRAKLDVKAVLTGEGADELHGGYAYFQHAALIADAAGDGPRAGETSDNQKRDRLSRFLARHGPGQGVLGAITPKLRKHLAWSRSGGTPYAAMRAQVAERGTRLLTTAEFRRQAEGKPARALLDWLGTRSPDARLLDDASLSRLVALQADLPGYNLCLLGDRVEMAHGLEARLPFLDSDVVDLLWRLPVSFHHGSGGESSRGDSKRVLRALLARHLPQTAQKPKRNFMVPSTLSCHLINGALAGHWLSMAKTRHAGIFQPAALAAAMHLVAVWGRHPSLAFYLSSYLTMALSLHLIVDMFCERFPQNLARRSAMSLGELRQRLGRDGPGRDGAGRNGNGGPPAAT
ncbi:MAG: asparagine synthase (glutamine-hydrolyzing) [Dongiaceae bacterium]